jgi:hypothetical protein
VEEQPDDRTERRWKFLEKWSVPLLAGALALGAVWHMVLQPYVFAEKDESTDYSEPYRPVEPAGYAAPSESAEDEIDRLLRDLGRMHERDADKDGATGDYGAYEPASRQFAARLIAIGFLLAPADADEAVHLLDEPSGGSHGPRAVSIATEYRRWIVSGPFNPLAFVPLVDVRIREAIAQQDNRCTRAIIAANRQAYVRAMEVLDAQTKEEPRPDWDDPQMEGMHRELTMRPAFEALFLRGGLQEPKEGEAPDWCRAP